MKTSLLSDDINRQLIAITMNYSKTLLSKDTGFLSTLERKDLGQMEKASLIVTHMKTFAKSIEDLLGKKLCKTIREGKYPREDKNVQTLDTTKLLLEGERFTYVKGVI